MKPLILLLLTSTALTILSACAKEEAPNCRQNILGVYEEIKAGPRDLITIQEGDGDKGIVIIWSIKNSNDLTFTINAELSENCNIIDIPEQTTSGLPVQESVLTTIDDRLQGDIIVAGGFIRDSYVSVLKR